VRAVVQRVSRAQVRVDGDVVGAINVGFCVLVSVGHGDDERTASRLAQRVATMRLFADAAGKMNLDATAAGAAVLVVSQFTLHADTSRGHRPSFLHAGPPALAATLCEVFAEELRRGGLEVAGGRFGAHMEVELVNDGPVTIVLTSGEPPWPADAG